MEGLKSIKRTIGKRSKVTLLDRLTNVGKNLVENPFQILLPILTAGALYGTVHLGIKAYQIGKLNEGYRQAYTQVQNVTGVLNSNTNFWENPPIASEVFGPIMESVELSISRQDSEKGQEVRGLVGRVEEAMYSPQPEGTNEPLREIQAKRAKVRSNLMNQLNEELKPLSGASGNYWSGASIFGLGTVALALLSLIALSEENFRDYNDSKKGLRRRYNDFLKQINSSVKDGSLDEEGLAYLGRFFEKIDLHNSDYYNVANLLGRLQQNLGPKSKPLLRTLSEHPCYDSSTLENLCSDYHNFRRMDRDSPLEGSRLKSRKELFLDIWSRDGSNDSRTITNVMAKSLSCEATIPEMLEALITGTRNLQGIRRAKKFLDGNVIQDNEIAVRLTKHYLQTSDGPTLPEDLGPFRHYAGQRVATLNPSEALSLLSELETLRVSTGRYEQDFSWLEKPGSEEMMKIALSALRRNPLLASKVIYEAPELIARVKPIRREAYGQIVSKGFVPTPYLIKRLYSAKDKNAELESWEQRREEIRQGGFNPSDELKRNLEYTHYCIEATKLGKDSDFKSYRAILEANQNG